MHPSLSKSWAFVAQLLLLKKSSHVEDDALLMIPHLEGMM
jgi:hypothetical protein